MELSQEVWITVLFYVLGFLGTLIHLILKVRETGALKIWDLRRYAREHSLVLMLSVCTYTALAVIWYFEGVDVFGMTKGSLNAMTLGWAYGSNSVWKTFLGTKMKPAAIEEDAVKMT